MNGDTWIFLALCGALLVFLLMASFLSKSYSLNNIKSKTVGDGQHGTARWATPKEIGKTYHTVPFRPRRWRKGKELPTEQGLILGSVGGRKRKSKGGFLRKTSRKLLEKLRRPVAGKQKRKSKKKSKVLSKVKKMIEEQGDIRALVDSDDIHCLMIGASGVGKTAFFLYPNLEYACACGMSFLALDTKGDLARNYGAIASRYYGYRVSVIDLRNPTRSDGFNFLTLMNHYMDIARADPSNLAARAKAEKYAKILAKTIISPDGDASQYGDSAMFPKAEHELYGKHAKNLMNTDVREVENGYEIDMNLPGFKKDEVEIQLQDGCLTVSAAKGLDKDEEDKKGRYIRQERYAGSLSRSFYVGEDVEPQDVKAKYENGVLKLFVPKAEVKQVPAQTAIAIE